MRYWIPIISLTVLLSQPLKAEPLTGNDLFHICGSNDVVKTAFCAGYIASMVEGLAWGASLVAIRLDAFESAEDLNEFNSIMLGYCMPTEADNAQVADVILKSLRENPESRHESARHLIVLALQDAFPCG